MVLNQSYRIIIQRQKIKEMDASLLTKFSLFYWVPLVLVPWSESSQGTPSLVPGLAIAVWVPRYEYQSLDPP